MHVFSASVGFLDPTPHMSETKKPEKIRSKSGFDLAVHHQSSELNGDGAQSHLHPGAWKNSLFSKPERGRFTRHKHQKILGNQTWDLRYFLKASGTVELYVQCVNTYVKHKYLCS